MILFPSNELTVPAIHYIQGDTRQTDRQTGRQKGEDKKRERERERINSLGTIGKLVAINSDTNIAFF